jgi:ATPase subunit of ABC transporter with duplicated ATPase domains
MSAVLLEADQLLVGYRRPVLGPVSFVVCKGEVVGLWGANATGKSTLLNAIAGGARRFGGELHRVPALSIGYQTQHPVRLAEMPLTGHEFLRFSGARREAPPERLRGWLDRRIDRLSGGQFQLLSVWAVLATAADLILLDEPTNNLDPEGERILSEILAAEQGRRAVLLVSHELGFLEQTCSRVVEIR